MGNGSQFHLFCLSSSPPARLGTYLELVLLVPPVMLLEAKLQPRLSSWQGRTVSRKLLQGSEMNLVSSLHPASEMSPVGRSHSLLGTFELSTVKTQCMASFLIGKSHSVVNL